MTSNIRTKICGLTTAASMDAAIEAGAAYIGLNFFQKSPRYVALDDARALAVRVPAGVAKVGLTVNADDATLRRITDHVPLDILQLHGAETPERVSEVRDIFGLPVMKAIGIADAADIEQIDRFSGVADMILIDAKPPKDAVLPGGNGLTFDWRLIANRRWTVPWLLAGGLTPDNVAEAVALTGTRQVDVSSGVESAPGEKDADLIRAFLKAAG